MKTDFRSASPPVRVVEGGGSSPALDLKTPKGRLSILLQLATRLDEEIHQSERVSAKLVEAFLKTLSQIREEVSLLEYTREDIDELLREAGLLK